SAQRSIIERHRSLRFEQTFVTAKNPDALPAAVGGSFCHRANHGIQAGTIAAASNHSNSLAHLVHFVVCAASQAARFSLISVRHSSVVSTQCGIIKSISLASSLPFWSIERRPHSTNSAHIFPTRISGVL